MNEKSSTEQENNIELFSEANNIINSITVAEKQAIQEHSHHARTIIAAITESNAIVTTAEPDYDIYEENFTEVTTLLKQLKPELLPAELLQELTASIEDYKGFFYEWDGRMADVSTELITPITTAYADALSAQRQQELVEVAGSTTNTAQTDSQTEYGIGSVEKEVGLFQSKLNQLLGINLDIDNHYGPKTAAAVRQFQEQSGIKVDGIVGSMTLNAMGLEFVASAQHDFVTVQNSSIVPDINASSTNASLGELPADNIPLHPDLNDIAQDRSRFV